MGASASEQVVNRKKDYVLKSRPKAPKAQSSSQKLDKRQLQAVIWLREDVKHQSKKKFRKLDRGQTGSIVLLDLHRSFKSYATQK